MRTTRSTACAEGPALERPAPTGSDWLLGRLSAGPFGAAAVPWARWEVLILAGLAALAASLRLHRLADAPLFMDNADEIQFAWAGMNLIMHGDPITWAYYAGYSSYTKVSAYGTTFPLVHHWMDHPPLFSLLQGGWLMLLGVGDMFAITAEQVRALPVLFSTATVVLVHVLGRRFVGPTAALFGAALLATSPGAILIGRQAEPESAQAVLLLVALLLTLRLVEGSGGSWTVTVLLACCLAAPLLKVPGVAIAGICAVILAVHGRWRLAAAQVGAAAAGLVIFAIYGWLIDWQLFVHIWGVQAGNRIGVMSGYDFITAPAGANRRLRDGWWILGWIGLALLLARGDRRRELFLVWPAVAYAAAMMVMAGERQAAQYGWYREIIYPSIYLAAGWLAWEAVRRRSPALLTLLLTLGGATATNWWLGGPDQAWVPHPVLLVIMLLAVLAPAAVAAWRRDRPGLRQFALGVAATALALLLIGNTVESFSVDRIFTRM